MTRSGAVLVSVNVGRPRQVEAGSRTVETAIWKAPVAGRVGVRGVNLEGDDQADRQAHGGPDKAVYSYATEDYEWWSAELGRALEPGTFGENLTIAGLDVSGAVIGERWVIGTAGFEVAQPRIPCGKLGLRMGDPRFPRRFAAAGRPGAYLRVKVEGEVGEGDPVEVVGRPDHGLTVAMVARAYDGDHELLPRMLGVHGLTEGWTIWAVEHAARALGKGPEDPVLRRALHDRLLAAGIPAAELDAAVEQLAAGA